MATMLNLPTLRIFNMKYIKLAFFTVSILLAVACSEGKYSKLSDAELREKQRHCDSIPKKSAVFASGCENISKETKRRKEKRKSG